MFARITQNLVGLGALCAIVAAPRGALGQQPNDVPAPRRLAIPLLATAGSAAERTLLDFALLDSTFGLIAIKPLPWTLSRDGGSVNSVGRERKWSRIGPWGTLRFATRPGIGGRDGAIWQGKGLTVALSDGVERVAKPFRLRLQPVVFWTQNARFAPPVPRPAGDFRHPYFFASIDAPYRFGDEPYGRLDAGESVAAVGGRWLELSASTTQQRWGPSAYYPLVLNDEAPGVPRLTAEVRGRQGRPGEFRAQWMIGRLWSSGVGGESLPPLRNMPALVVTGSPLRGIEVGVARAFQIHGRQPLGWAGATLPFVGLLKQGNPTSETDTVDYNQVASVFGRIAPAGAGFEAYGEFYREDHSADLRDFIGEPDHASAFVVGTRRAWRSSAGSVHTVTLEALNSRMSHLQKVRFQGAPYLHHRITEGHTNRGQVLGSGSVPGGGGFIAAYACISETTTQWMAFELRREGQDSQGGGIEGRPVGTLSLTGARTTIRKRRVGQASVTLFAGFGKQFTPGVAFSYAFLDWP